MKNNLSRRRFIKNSALFVGEGMSFLLLRTFADNINAPDQIVRNKNLDIRQRNY
jgi:hypothetical protein